jgi:hypothetical protein
MFFHWVQIAQNFPCQNFLRNIEGELLISYILSFELDSANMLL